MSQQHVGDLNHHTEKLQRGCNTRCDALPAKETDVAKGLKQMADPSHRHCVSFVMYASNGGELKGSNASAILI